MSKRHSIYLMYGIMLFQGMVFYSPVATLYRKAQGVTLFQMSIIECLSILLMIVLEMPWGYIADRIGYKKTMIICNLLFWVSKVVFWKATGFGWFMAERIILSFVCAGLSGCDSAYLFVLSGEENSHKVFGIYTAMSNVGLIAAAIIFSTVVKDNYALAGFLTVISYAVALLLTLPLKEVEISDRRSTADFCESMRAVLTAVIADKRFFLFLIAVSLVNKTCNYIAVFVNQLQYLRVGIPTEYMGYLYIVVTMSSLVAAYSHRMTGFFGENKTLLLLMGVAGCSCVVLAITNSAILSVLCMVLLRGAVSLLLPASMQVQNKRIRIADRATMLSVYACVMDTGEAFSSLIIGKVADIDVSRSMWTGALFCFVGIGLYLRYLYPKCKQ